MIKPTNEIGLLKIQHSQTCGANGCGGDNFRQMANAGAGFEVKKSNPHQLPHQVQPAPGHFGAF